MTLSEGEFEAILRDTSKVIQNDIVWKIDPHHELLFKFKAEIVSDSGDNPIEVWRQFCNEAVIRHDGVMQPIPEQQLDIFL